MADTKISGLAALTGPDAADLLVGVDVSDTTMAATGTDKKISLATLAGFLNGYGTLAARPAATTRPDGATYFATDDNSGTLYEVQGGAWVKVAASVTQGAGTRLSLGQHTTDLATTNVYPTMTTLTALSQTITTSGPIRLLLDGQGMENNTASGGFYIEIRQDGTKVAAVQYVTNPVNTRIPFFRNVPLNPTAGSHTYTVVFSALNASTATLRASADSPVNLEIVSA